MRKRARKTTGLAALLTMAALALTTACAGSDGDEDKGGSGGGGDRGDKGASSAPAGPSPLDRLIIAGADLADYTVNQGKPEGWASGQPTSSDPECQPLADATGDKPSAAARETVRRGVNAKADPAKGVTTALSTYDAADAKSYMRDLEAALAACGEGFDTTLDGNTVGYGEVRTLDVPTRADDTVAYTMTAVSQGQKIVMHFVAVRSDATIATFTALDLRHLTAGYPVPQEVVDKQIKKLGA
ncbi:sensor domain-containing protein [Streptomyces sp. SAJ15]|uniref:sensor domain-containing protein n=1 Tax=Streptomyces sp. SAJ15 TaxID=2011095 RepID=UPI00118693ED|nr:sensor domain-containing protein [Streptomyces sp. SAJ15]